MKIKLLIASLWTAASCNQAHAQVQAQAHAPAQKVHTEQDWTALENEPSRQQLFETHLHPSNEQPNLGFDIFAVKKDFVFPVDAKFDSVSNQKRVDSIFGLDINHYKPNIPFDQLRAQNISFVYAKATQGVHFKDGLFATFWKAMGALPTNKKVFRGAYHFLSADSSSSAIEQAESFVNYLKLQGGLKSSDLPPVMDLEWDKAPGSNVDQWRRFTAQQIINKALDFLTHVEKLTGRTPIVYTSHAWWRERGIPEAEMDQLKRFGLWIADYSQDSQLQEIPDSPDRVRPTLWQFTDHSRLKSGSAEVLDANIFHGTSKDFMSTFFHH